MMEALLKVGNSKTIESVQQTALAIDKIFRSAHENHIDQQTIIQALHALAQVAEIKNITITNSVFKGGHVISLDRNSDVDSLVS
jgi:hypothetical protein